MDIGIIIAKKRKQLGLTQQDLAGMLTISSQAISKWENGTSYPDINLLPEIAKILGTSVDTLLGYKSPVSEDYDTRYEGEEYYWGLNPNRLCYEIMKLRPPVRPYKVLEIGCGEGKDAAFLAKNGYLVSVFDLSDVGLDKARRLANQSGVHVNFFKADIMEYRVEENYDIILSSGVFHFVKPECKDEIFENLKVHTNAGGIHAVNVFVQKPFIPAKSVNRYPCKSGELFLQYYDWLLREVKEEVFDCNRGGVLHQHCMDTVIAEKYS